MKADENHYKSHWEFFQSINPKADERFFVELQINEFDKRIKQGLKEIDFANDSIDTVESYENDLKRKDFFFYKEYKEFLDAKLKELKSKECLRELPNLENTIIVHYGCSDFNSNEHKVYWIGAISHTPNKTYFFENSNEIEVIEKIDKYIQSNKEKTFIHWSMNSPKFGFRAIENRYFTLTNNKIDLQPKNEIDLSEYFKNKYGINYIERQNGRLNNLAKLNGFSGLQSDVEVVNINDATNRLELIFSIVQAEIQGNLKTNLQILPPQQTTTENDTIKYTAKYYVLGYLIECNAKGESFPIGQKKELEKIGNEKMGTGKGNRFYKVFNEIVNKDLNIESNLIEIGGENWRTIVKDLSNEPETIETYLQSKQL